MVAQIEKAIPIGQPGRVDLRVKRAKGCHLDGVYQAQDDISRTLTLRIRRARHYHQAILPNALPRPFGHGHFLGIADGRLGRAARAQGMNHCEYPQADGPSDAVKLGGVVMQHSAGIGHGLVVGQPSLGNLLV